MTKMCFKQGKSDPGGFKQFLRQENIKPGIIVRYVGNRLHVVFHLAGVLYYLRDNYTFELFILDTSCHNTTSLRSELLFCIIGLGLGCNSCMEIQASLILILFHGSPFLQNPICLDRYNFVTTYAHFTYHFNSFNLLVQL